MRRVPAGLLLFGTVLLWSFSVAVHESPAFLAAVFALLVLSEGLSGLQIAGRFVIAVGLVLGRRRSLPAPQAE